MTYRQIRDEAVDPQIKSLYQAKLDVGTAFELSIQAGESNSFHSFVMRQSADQMEEVHIKN